MRPLIVRGKALDDSLSRACIVFDPKDGRVIHVHGVTTLAGAKQTTDAELEKDAKRHAQAFGHALAGARMLHLPMSAMHQPGPFKVNAQGTGLEAIGKAPVRASEFFAKWRDENAKKGKK
jgi:hypothetical protein